MYSYDWTWFDTSWCLMNDAGRLSAYDSGDYWRSCKGCTVHASEVEFILNCTCLFAGFSVAAATYDLNKVVWNHDGFLGCFGHFGNRTERGPF